MIQIITPFFLGGSDFPSYVLLAFDSINGFLGDRFLAVGCIYYCHTVENNDNDYLIQLCELNHIREELLLIEQC